MLAERIPEDPPREITCAEPLPSLLEQCRRVSVEARTAESEPIRTIHHLACSGGTLIAKCIASLPNTHVLSEVDPLSAQAHASKEPFFPTDLIRLARVGSRSVDEQLLIDIFLAGLDVIYKNARAKGLRMIVRDHAHSQFYFGDIQARPTVKEIVAQRFNLRSVVTVRHPLDSYMSLKNNGWIHFQPDSINEYCRRYHLFLDHYENTDLYRYEDFIAGPKAVLKKIATTLELRFDDSFEHLFSVHRLSGDSGRSGRVISPRPRRTVPDNVIENLTKSDNYRSLCKRLEYSPDDAGNE